MKGKKNLNINLITGYDITVNEYGNYDFWCHGLAKSDRRQIIGHINQDAVNEIKTEFILKNQY